jgi:hypothetical protein
MQLATDAEQIHWKLHDRDSVSNDFHVLREREMQSSVRYMFSAVQLNVECVTPCALVDSVFRTGTICV